MIIIKKGNEIILKILIITDLLPDVLYTLFPESQVNDTMCLAVLGVLDVIRQSMQEGIS